MTGEGDGAGGDGDAGASLPAWAPSFLEEASLEHREETLRGAIACSLSFSKNGPEPSFVWRGRLL